MIELSAVQARLVGSLIEKQLTTPQQYPLTLNALVAACNQTSNREPVVAYDDTTVSRCLDELKAAGLLRFVHPSHGRSATRYRQVLDELLGLDERELAVLGVLLLRGPQTAGELRIRTERMAHFADLPDLERVLSDLAGRDEGLVVRLDRQPGQRDARWVDLLGARPALEASGVAAPNPPSLPAERATQEVHVEPDASEVASLRDEVAALRQEVASLRAMIE